MSRSHPHRPRQAVRVLALSLTITLVACATSPVPYTSVIDSYAIVRQNALDAFEVALDAPQDGQALQDFLAATEKASNRDGLVQAWQRNTTLSAKGPDFLRKKVFALAESEKRWPNEPVPEIVYVKGVRDAAKAFLKE